MKKRIGTGITLFVALIFVLINLPASPAWAEPGDVAINATNFPDATFRDYVSTKFDKDNNGKLSDTEIAHITSISVTSENIADLKGIEYFTALQTLNCAYNQLRSLDISKNTALKVLNCHDNKLTNLDLSKNTALETLKCSVNQLTNLDVSKNPALISLTCFSSQLTNLDVSKNTALKELLCDGNQLRKLDVSKNTALQRLECWENQLTSLDVSKNTALKKLWCKSNQLTKLDVSKNTKLQGLNCNSNQLTSLDVSKNRELVHLNCMENQLTSLDLSHNIAGSRLKCNAQKYDVEIRTTDMKIPYADFPGTFDITKAGYIVGADSNFKVDLTKPSTVTYNYYTGSDTILGSYPTMYNITLNITYYVYIVRFDTNGGTEVSVQIIKQGDHVTIPTAPTKDGFTFAGWYKDAGLTTPFDVETETINADITLYAKWTPTTPTNYTVTFNTNGGSAINPQTITAGGLVTKPAAPTKDGYTFAGWYKDAEFTKAFDFANETINADTTIYAKWTQNAVTPTPEQFTITFDKNGGTGIMADVTVNKGETYTLPDCKFAAPEGKTFKAWEVDGTEKAVGDSIKVNANTTVKALWKEAGQPSKPHGGGVSSSTGTVTEPKEPQKPDEEKPAIDGSSAAYLAGYPDGSIRPDGVITRAESAKIIALLKEMDVSNTEKPAFGDVASGWYNPYINAVVRAGL
ncbi:InlB B-repeat-containing protein, partial [Peptococcus niger]|uniref:InlB B-repeat-containing protein n=1 Tax=Peptococcus niger TaxID=2741 RepID=UPI000B29A53F